MSDDPFAPVEGHVRRFFAGHQCTAHRWPHGPAASDVPALRVLRFGPGPRTDAHSYVSVGGSAPRPDAGRLEFVLLAPGPDDGHVELVTIAAWYHRRVGLGVGHTVPIGRPWLPGSALDHVLVSRPYPLGPDLEVCPLGDDHAHVLWLLPITAAEREFKAEHGLDPLEERFDAAGIDVLDPGRPSVV